MKKNNEESIVILVGNKSDLTDKIEISKKEIEKFKSDNNFNYFEVSYLKREGIDEMFKFSIAESLKKLILKQCQSPNNSFLLNDSIAQGRVSFMSDQIIQVKLKKIMQLIKYLK